MFRHRVNDIEHNIKQNNYTDIQTISLLPLMVLYIKKQQ